MRMKIVILTFIAVLISCPYKSAHGGCCGGKSSATTDNTEVTLDISKTSSTNDFEYSTNKDIKTYTPKSNKLFSKIVKNNVDLWASKDSDHAIKVVVKVEAGSEKHLAILLKSLKFVFLSKAASNKPWEDHTSKKHDVTKLKFYGDSDKELTTSDYKVDLVKLSYTFIFNSGVNCKKIKYEDKDLWKSTDDPNFRTFKELLLGLKSNDFFLHKDDKEFKKIKLDQSNTATTPAGQTGTGTTQPGTGATTTPATTTPSTDQTGSTTTTTTPGGQTGTGTRAPATTTTGAAQPRSTSGTTTPGVTTQAGSTQPKEPAKAKPAEPPEPELKPEPTSDTSSTPVALNINKNSNTNDSEFSKNKKTDCRTFTAKSGKSFNKIVKKKLNIWESQNNDNAVKVVLMGSKKNEKHLALLLQSGQLVLLKKIGKGKPWTNTTGERFDVSKLKFYGDGDCVGKSSHYKVTIVDKSYEFLFNDGVKCLKVKYAHDDVWKSTSPSTLKDITKFSLDLVSNSFFVHNSESDKEIEFRPTPAKAATPTTPVSQPATTPTQAQAPPAQPATTPARPAATAAPVSTPALTTTTREGQSGTVTSQTATGATTTTPRAGSATPTTTTTGSAGQTTPTPRAGQTGAPISQSPTGATTTPATTTTPRAGTASSQPATGTSAAAGQTGSSPKSGTPATATAPSGKAPAKQAIASTGQSGSRPTTTTTPGSTASGRPTGATPGTNPVGQTVTGSATNPPVAGTTGSRGQTGTGTTTTTPATSSPARQGGSTTATTPASGRQTNTGGSQSTTGATTTPRAGSGTETSTTGSTATPRSGTTTTPGSGRQSGSGAPTTTTPAGQTGSSPKKST